MTKTRTAEKRLRCTCRAALRNERSVSDAGDYGRATAARRNIAEVIDALHGRVFLAGARRFQALLTGIAPTDWPRSIQAIAISENLPARHTYEATPDLLICQKGLSNR